MKTSRNNFVYILGNCCTSRCILNRQCICYMCLVNYNSYYLYFQLLFSYHKKTPNQCAPFLAPEVLQHYLWLDDEIREPFFVCTTLGSESGTLLINSSSWQSKASQIKSRCSRLTLPANSWYKSLIVFGQMPVALAKSACVHLISPSFADSKILIIRHRSFHYKITFSNVNISGMI